jgi:hypothetical protein
MTALADLLTAAVWLTGLGIAMSAFVVVAFDWSLPQMIPGALIGAAVWGAMKFFTDVRERMPKGTRLPVAPPETSVERDRWRPLRVVLFVPMFAGLAWLADRWDLGPAFVPGQYLGYALADFTGAVLVSRWQSHHGGTVLLRWNRDEPELYSA